MAKLLLDRSADANAYTMKGNADERLDQTQHRYTALTGLFGGGPTGMANQPRHQHWRELAEMLFAHGADPNDEQTAVIGQGPKPTFEKLEILLLHGLKPDARTRQETNGGITLMGLVLSKAAIYGDAEIAKLLLAHAVRTDETFRSKTPWQHAMERGHPEIARMLEAAHAPVSELDEVERFVSFCLAGDEHEARALLAQYPHLVEHAPKQLALRAETADESKRSSWFFI